MIWMRMFLAPLVAIAMLAGAVWAVQPDEVLDDPVLESRAREISKELRCLVCRNENIDESNADLARDLRLLVRERLVAGDSDAEVVDYVVDRFGEYVLLRPRTGGSNIMLWAAGPGAFVLALIMAGLYLRRRSTVPPRNIDGLSAQEAARLKEILKD